MSMESQVNNVREIANIAGWTEMVWYWRTHLDVFIVDYLHVPLKDTQRVEARAFGNGDTLFLTQSRGYGKTWICAICCIALAILYPRSFIAVVSATAQQATLMLKKIEDEFADNENIRKELDYGSGKKPVNVNANKGVVRFGNGSKIESYSLGTFLGSRAKVIVVDEAPEVKEYILSKVVKPVRNTTRSHCVANDIPDYPSKLVSITSACLKSNYFYTAFCDALKKLGQGDTSYFACALDEKERETLPEVNFRMEYGTIFMGAESGSIFPYELTERCRNLTEVETAQPAKSTSQYVITLDLATSAAKHADNAVITVLKLIEREDGMYIKKLVYIRSYHGKRLDALAVELRKLLVRFPNTIKVVFDYRGLGDAFPQFLSQPWTDPETNKEYPPLVMDTEHSIIHDAVPLLRPCAANNQINQQLVSQTTINFERELIQIPINSRYILGNTVVRPDEDDEGDSPKNQRNLTQAEKAIFVETDALQIEMGNVVSRETASGAIVYDTAKSTQHKDRWSSLAMGLRYVSELEEERKVKLARNYNNVCIGVVTTF